MISAFSFTGDDVTEGPQEGCIVAVAWSASDGINDLFIQVVKDGFSSSLSRFFGNRKIIEILDLFSQVGNYLDLGNIFMDRH